MRNYEKSFRKFKKGPVLLALLFLALSCFGLWYVLKSISENKAVAKEALLVWEKEESRRNELKSLDAFISKTEADRAQLDLHFAQSSNVVPFLDSLEELGQLAGAKSEVMSVEVPKDGGGLVVAVEAKGNFGEVYKFLELLENSPYELEFLNADIGRTGEGETKAAWEGLFKIRLLTFMP
jgi:hypothetical protein